MILLFGRIADPILANLSAHLAGRSAELVLIDPSRMEGADGVEWQVGADGMVRALRIGRRSLDVPTIGAMFVREIGSAELTSTGTRPVDKSRARGRAESLWSLADAFTGLVVNRRSASCTNASKPYQIQLIRAQGFRVPDTLVTMQPAAAREFFFAHEGGVIYKSLSAERSVVRQLSADDLGRLDLVQSCPVQLQELIAGVDIRVHVVGEQVFATQVRSSASDYRYAEHTGETREMRPITLPPGIADQCVRLTRSLGLVVAGIDLRRLPGGEYCCFEVNPSPAYLWFEDVTGQRIGRAIADLLCRGTVCS